jgi:hypothetical protein
MELPGVALLLSERVWRLRAKSAYVALDLSFEPSTRPSVANVDRPAISLFGLRVWVGVAPRAKGWPGRCGFSATDKEASCA